MNDPVVEEIRKYREQYAAKFNYDLAAICKDLRERQKTCGRKVVSRPAKKADPTPSTRMHRNKPRNSTLNRSGGPPGLR